MASQQTTEKSRRKRQQRGKAATANAASADEATSIDTIGGKAGSKQSNKKFPHDSESVLSQQIENAGAMTPPRQKARNHGSQDGRGANGQQSNRKKGNYNGDASTATPGPKKAKSGAGTTTPSKPVIEMAYAGPTFHASPAPSALPVPKFLSKSAPPVEHLEGINARLQQEESSSGSEQSPDSPTRPTHAKASTTGNQAPAPALFNMLINADREEKARQRVPPNSVPAAHESTTGRSGHNRTLTAGSVFPMDMDGSSGRSTPASANHHHHHHHHQQQQQQQQPPNQQPNRGASPARPNQPPPQQQQQQPYTSPDDGNLKRMLFSSPSQGTSHGQASYPYGSPSQSLNGWNSSPASRSNNSPYGTPPSASSINGLAASSRPAPVSPYTQGSPSPAVRRSLYTTQNNSGLRQELSPGPPPHLSPPPQNNNNNNNNPSYAPNHSPLGSPIAQRFPNGALNYSPYGSHGHNSPARNHSPAYYGTPPSSKFGPQDALKASLGKDQHTLNTASMEDALRKVLRLDPLRATAATAPPS